MKKTIIAVVLAACASNPSSSSVPRVDCELEADASSACTFKLGSGTTLAAGYVCQPESKFPYGCQMLGSDDTGYIACCPATCGDDVCQPLELATDSCPADCGPQ